jgi:hypothetical protein
MHLKRFKVNGSFIMYFIMMAFYVALLLVNAVKDGSGSLGKSEGCF